MDGGESLAPQRQCLGSGQSPALVRSRGDPAARSPFTTNIHDCKPVAIRALPHGGHLNIM